MTIRVLIVDDDEKMRDQFSLTVSRAIGEYNSKTGKKIGFHIDKCASCVDAMLKISTTNPDSYYDIAIIDNILDVNMSLSGGCGSFIVDEIMKKNKLFGQECRILFCSSELNEKKQDDALGSISTDKILDIPLELKNGPRFSLRISQSVIDVCRKFVV